jgi:hypothetical protein
MQQLIFEPTFVLVRDKQRKVQRTLSCKRVCKFFFLAIMLASLLRFSHNIPALRVFSILPEDDCVLSERILCLVVAGDSENELETARLY